MNENPEEIIGEVKSDKKIESIETCQCELSTDVSFGKSTHASTSSSKCSCGYKPAKYKATPVTKKMKIGRNDKCPCNSGKKYKKCCLI